MINRLRAANTAIWLAIIFIGCAATFSQVIFDNDKAALLLAFLSVCGWTFWYLYSTWLFGMRRRVTRFMNQSTDRLTFVDRHVSTNRLADVVQAMQKHQETNPTDTIWAMAAGSSSKTTVRIVDRPSAARDDVVLPDEVLSLTETLMLGRVQPRQRLARFGHSSRLGLLFYGAPGTGKTLVTKYLLSKLADHTVVVPTDLEPETLWECFRLAAYLEPTVVIIEDVDLLATNRTEANGRLDGLQELMNEMDGLSSSSDTMAILSTNRPDVLEPALASRPGRVSQAIEFPLPDQEARERLLSLFLSQVNASDQAPGVATESLDSVNVDLALWAKRTDRASPAFLQELCKRAILLAGDQSTGDSSGNDASGNETIVVTDDNMREAIHQLVVTGGELNANVLGFPHAEGL